jgi:hypothetical protein
LAVSDFQINSRVRGIFSKHWLDTSQLSVVTIKGNVYLGGRLRKLPAVSSDIEINEELMEAIDFEIGRIRGVKRVTYRLEEWRKEAGKFISLTAKRKSAEDDKKRAEDMARRAGFVKEERHESS